MLLLPLGHVTCGAARLDGHAPPLSAELSGRTGCGPELQHLRNLGTRQEYGYWRYRPYYGAVSLSDDCMSVKEDVEAHDRLY
jgi:hypothetical protein